MQLIKAERLSPTCCKGGSGGSKRIRAAWLGAATAAETATAAEAAATTMPRVPGWWSIKRGQGITSWREKREEGNTGDIQFEYSHLVQFTAPGCITHSCAPRRQHRPHRRWGWEDVPEARPRVHSTPVHPCWCCTAPPAGNRDWFACTTISGWAHYQDSRVQCEQVLQKKRRGRKYCKVSTRLISNPLITIVFTHVARNQLYEAMALD